MASPRVKERLKLDDDCISAFSQSETLDEANPWYKIISILIFISLDKDVLMIDWFHNCRNLRCCDELLISILFSDRYCPDCRKNQCATKTLTVWRFPDFLILYLKRCVQQFMILPLIWFISIIQYNNIHQISPSIH